MAKIERKKFGGLQAQKFQYDIDVISAAAMPAGESIYVFLTRGPKVAMTKETTSDPNGQAFWGERLSLMCTMYKSPTGKYQEKSAKLCCKEKKKRKTVGEIRLNLADFTGMDETRSITYKLQPAGLGKSKDQPGGAGELSVTIACKFIAPSGDDAPSDMSDLSAMDDGSQMSFGSIGDEEDALQPTPVDGAANVSQAAAGGRVQQLEERVSEQEELISDLRRQNTELSIAASGTSTAQASTSESLDQAQAEILRLQTAHRDLLQSETQATELAAGLKQQLSQVKADLERAQADAAATVIQLKQERQGRSDQREESEREVQKLQAENQAVRGDAEASERLLTQEIEELRARLAGEEEVSGPRRAGGERCGQSGGEGSVGGSPGLERHYQEMLEMRGQELDEAKSRVQSYKEKLRDCQELLEQRSNKIDDLDRLLTAEQQERSALQQLQDTAEAARVDAADEQTDWMEEKATSWTVRGGEGGQEEMRRRIEELEKQQAETGPIDLETQEHITRIEQMLIEAKMGWAQAEEDKAIAQLKTRQLKDQVNKGRELNLQFAKRMTKLEVKLSKEKENRR